MEGRGPVKEEVKEGTKDREREGVKDGVLDGTGMGKDPVKNKYYLVPSRKTVNAAKEKFRIFLETGASIDRQISYLRNFRKWVHSGVTVADEGDFEFALDFIRVISHPRLKMCLKTRAEKLKNQTRKIKENEDGKKGKRA